MGKGMPAIVIAACAACGGGSGGGSNGSASVSGTIGGQSMTPRDAISKVVHVGSDSAGFILVTNADSTCAKLNAHQQPKNVQVLGIELGIQGSSGAGAPPGPGIFPVYSSTDARGVVGPVAIAAFASGDATCNPSASFEAVTGGAVTLTRVDANGYAGTFDLTFSGGAGHVTGSFSTTQCAILGTTVGGTCI